MEKGRATKQRVIAEAASVFNQRGSPVRRWRPHGGYGSEERGIYRYFAGKEDLASKHSITPPRSPCVSGSRDRSEVRIVGKAEAVRDEFRPPPLADRRRMSDLEYRPGLRRRQPTLHERAKAVFRSWLCQLAEIVREGKVVARSRKTSTPMGLPSCSSAPGGALTGASS